MIDSATARERIPAVLDRLTREYGEVRSFLDYSSPFELLIAVILSAQTTDRQVNLITPELFGRFKTPALLAAADTGELEQILHSIGFFRTKARNIKACAARIVQDFGGVVPESMEELTSLPGVGRKSANVIRGTIFGKPAIIVDTHFGRVARRLGFAAEKDPTKVEHEVARLSRSQDHMKLSMLLNKHGRIYCHARAPECAGCPVRNLCPSAE